ncbi:hypothetical protein [Corallococcus exiguus]|uniref:hypothetical protein n=1 Tax=Corallococcus exiguus TaxID=83462 RepID=UPI003DA2E5C6
MRVAIIAGLMTVGLILGCGGPEAEGTAEASDGRADSASAQSASADCYDACSEKLRICYRKGGGTNECFAAFEACEAKCELAGAAPSRQDESAKVLAAGLPPDNICHVWCDVGPRAGYRTSAYAGSIAACFAFARDECGESGTYTYNGQAWAF